MDKVLLDTKYAVETPESIDLSAQLAGPLPRILAFAIDLLIRGIISTILFFLLVAAGEAGLGVLAVLSFLMEWFYPVLFEVLRNGQTPGKKRMGIMVVNDDLTPVTWSTSLIRNLLRAADFLPFGYLFGIVAMCCNRHFQRLGDMAAGSIVIYRRDNSDWSTKLPEVAAVPPPVALALEDQVAFTDFSRRSEEISDSRKQELANILEPILSKHGETAVSYAQGIGNWLLGKRQ